MVKTRGKTDFCELNIIKNSLKIIQEFAHGQEFAAARRMQMKKTICEKTNYHVTLDTAATLDTDVEFCLILT